MATGSYENLKIYKKSYELAMRIQLIVMDLPKQEQFGEGLQIQRSSKSITSNIVEGYGRRRYKADYIKFLTYAHASCDETIVHLNFLYDSKYLSKEDYEDLKKEYNHLSRMIHKFIKSVEKG
jgi:four helix bundle protein